jgi:hypothetical protein
MSIKDIFLNAFRNKMSAPGILLADLTYWRDARKIEGNLPEKYRGQEGFLKLHTDLGVVPYYIYTLDDEEIYTGNIGLRMKDTEIETVRDANTFTTLYHHHGKTLTQVKEYMPASFCYGFKRYPVTSPEELEVLTSIIEGYEFYPAQEDWNNLAALWDGYGVPIAPLPRSPLSALMTDWMGVEGFIYAEMDHPDLIRTVLAKIDSANDAAFEIAVRSPVELFHFCDNLSAANYGSYYNRYLGDYYRKRFSQLTAAGKHAATHLDGTIRGLLSQLAASGAESAEALTPEPAGDIPAENLRKEAGNGDIILWGGFPGCLFTPQYGKDYVDRQISSVVRALPEIGPFIPGTADQIPPDGDISLVKYTADRLRDAAG